ncbi:MAG: alpha/beta hydrolase [Pseudorhodoplanes sp.]
MPEQHQNNGRPGVVFIHGVGGSAAAWQWQVASFAAAGYSPLAVDLPGYGGRPPIQHTDFEQLSQDVEAQIAKARLVRPVLVGHSLGGFVAQTMMRRKPQGYQAVVLAGTSPAFGRPEGDFQRKFVEERLAPLRSGATMPQLAAEMINGIMALGADPEGRKIAIASMGAVPPQTYQACVEAIVTFEERANLGQIDVPVLCLVGEFDRQAPAPMMQRMAQKIPGAKFVILPGLGHMPNLENRAAFDAAVLDYLGEVLPRSVEKRSAAT